MDRTTHRTSEISVAEDNDAGGSAPLTDTSLPPSQASVKKDRRKEINFESGFEILREKREISKAKIISRFNLSKRMLDHVKPLNDPYRGYTYCNDLSCFDILRREDRKGSAELFRNQYIYGTSPGGPDGCTNPGTTEGINAECFQIQYTCGADGCTNPFASTDGRTNPFASTNGCTKPFAGTKEKRICIGSKDHCFWEEKSSGIMWVCVHGMDSVCVVTRSGDLDWKRVRSGFRWTNVRTVLSYFRISIISEIEDLVDTPSKQSNMIIEKPFGVVCVPDTTDIHNECGHEASSIGYDVGKAMKFLQDKMTSETSFTVNETIQTAISAFQHLLQKKFTANEIEVSVMDPKYRVLLHEKKDPSVKRLEICEIEDYLVAINEPGPGETEHEAVIDDHFPPSKRRKMSLGPETQFPSTGGSTNTSDSF